jgi:transglutaminase-like putative cysteine protease
MSAINRRRFLLTSGLASVFVSAARRWRLLALEAARMDDWRTFEVTTRVEVRQPSGITRVWMPEALTDDMPFQRTLANVVQAEGGTITVIKRSPDALAIVSALFPAGVPPVLTLTSRVSTRDYAVDLSSMNHEATPQSLDYFRRPTKLIPTSGVVESTAREITKGARSDIDKARAIYEWVVDRTSRNPQTRGCGTGNIRFMLESGDLSGKCADINSLFVGLARASGLAARDAYGLRVAPSRQGYTSLGTASDNVTKAQHCRAEVYASGYGWVPVDPADVRKVALEEPPGHRPLDDEMVKRARARLFGSWEMNWIAYNFAQDVELPGSGSAVPFLMYPQAETGGARVESLDPDAFHYAISAREIS